ncbi:hypothetical protein SDC9_135570 [bioreactor metagenome]|uniref:Uncharacterized protein n=1 Tax=bioreactor metagenome TaxID=1076179 RepID=A0A645DGK3_9ZZZZ
MLAFFRVTLPDGRRAFSREGKGKQKSGFLRVFQAGSERILDDALHALCQILIQIKSGGHDSFPRFSSVDRRQIVCGNPSLVYEANHTRGILSDCRSIFNQLFGETTGKATRMVPMKTTIWRDSNHLAMILRNRTTVGRVLYHGSQSETKTQPTVHFSNFSPKNAIFEQRVY